MSDTNASLAPQSPEDAIRTDQTGDVDMSLIEYMLSLTPTKRLARLEEFATLILDARRARVTRGESNGGLPRINQAAARK
jgi:hypothetical protein